MPNASKNILYISHSGWLGGAERCFLEATQALQKQGHKIWAILPHEDWLAAQLKSIQIPYIVISPQPHWVSSWNCGRKEKIKLWPNYIAYMLKISSLILQFHIDLVITNTVTVNPGAALAARICGKKHIWYLHEFGDLDHDMIYLHGRKFTHRLIGLLSDAIVANSKATAAYFAQHIPEEKINVVYYAVANANEPASPQATRDILHPRKLIISGRTTEGKGQMDAVKAIDILRKKYPDIILTLLAYSKGTYFDSIMQFVKDNNLQNNIRLVETTDRPFPIVSQQHIGLVCSRMEAFGRVTVEYLKCGIPVVGARSGATPEIITEGYNGLLYQPGNAEELAQKISEMIEHYELYKINVANSFSSITQTYSLEKFALNFQKIISRLFS